MTIDGEEFSWSLDEADHGRLSLLLNGRSYEVFAQEDASGMFAVTIDQCTYDVKVQDEYSEDLERTGEPGLSEVLTAPMPGMVRRVMVEPGDNVESGQGLLVLEAMKMENELRAAGDGIVKAVHIEPGQAVQRASVLIEFE